MYGSNHMKYAIYYLSISEKAWILHASKKLKTIVLVLWQNQKNTEKMTFECDLGNFVYDSIWLNMMYIIEKHCLKWFSSKVSHENIHDTMKYDETRRKKTK